MSNHYISLSVKCSVCGNVRGPSNHWWAVNIKDIPYKDKMLYGDKAEGAPMRPPQSELSVRLLTDAILAFENDSLYPACGAECVNKLVSSYLSKEGAKDELKS